MALGSTQPLTEMSTRGISWGVKAAGAYAVAMKSGNLNFLETYGPLQACNGIASPFKVYIYTFSDTQKTRLEQSSDSLLDFPS